jgi:broad specificity phosphatase PhoE
MSSFAMADLLSIPAFLLFHIVWLFHSIRRPLLLVSTLCVLADPFAALRKLELIGVSIAYLLLCKDKKWKVPTDVDPASEFPAELGGSSKSSGGSHSHKYREKTLILIRHGESTWNDTFNPGQRNKVKFLLLFVPNLVYAILVEVYYFVSGRDRDSWFYDSPLSVSGKHQIDGLRSFLKKEGLKVGGGGDGGGGSSSGREGRAIRILLALGGKKDGKKEGERDELSSHVVSSSLRRAISTAAIGLADRFSRTAAAAATEDDHDRHGADRIVLLPSMQEISFNPDALSILPPRGTANPTWCDEDIAGLPRGKFSSLVDARYHTGNKSINSTGLIRLEDFVSDVFDDDRLPRNNVVAVGHSLFFRSFFRVYLPRGTAHVAKEKKLVNGGAVMLTLREATLDGEEGKKAYMIDPNSIVVVYGGFGKHTKG